MIEAEMDVLLDVLALEHELHDGYYERRWQRTEGVIPCADPFGVWTCPWSEYTYRRARERRAV